MGQRQQKALLKTADILPLLNDIAAHRQEHFIVLSLDSGRRLITKRVVFIGTVDAVIAQPRIGFTTTEKLKQSGVFAGEIWEEA